MDDYRKTIDRLISRADGEIALNGSPSHAAIVLERMFTRAHRAVRIMTRHLDPLIYFDRAAVRAATEMLRSGKSLKILVDEFDEARLRTEPGLEILRDYNDFEIRQVPDGLRASIALNFSVMDARGFRIEKDHSGATAVISFGKKDINDRLVSLFDEVWAESKPVKEFA